MNLNFKTFIHLLFLISIIGILGCLSLKPSNEEKNRSITINADEYTAPLIFAVLNRTDINISMHIKSINILPHEYIISNSTCINESSSIRVGCVNYFFKSKQLNMADIYVTNLDGPSNKLYEFNFNFTLYHEIGHVDQVRNIGYDAYMNNSVQFAEQYANEYAYGHVLNCDFSTYKDIIQKLQETENKLDELAEKLEKWRNYTKVTPERLNDDKLYYAALDEKENLMKQKLFCNPPASIDEKLYKNRTQNIYLYNISKN
jgi:hypothetical protein